VFCLGVEGVVGICERLIYNFPLWKAGFPDLIVWNADTKQASKSFFLHTILRAYIKQVLRMLYSLLNKFHQIVT